MYKRQWWGWGGNSLGSLGLNDRASRSSPTQLPGTDWVNIVHNRVSLGVKTDGTLWAWGDGGDLGLLGMNQPNNFAYSSPTQIGTDTNWSSAVGALKGGAGGGSNAAIKTDGSLWMWGKNQRGSLGLNQGPSQLAQLSSPTQVPGVYTEIQATNQEQYGTWSMRGV